MTTAITEHLDLLNSGWHFSAGQANKTDTYNDITGVTANSGFTFISRKGYGGEYVAATVVLSDLLNDAQTLTELSVTFDYSASANPGLGFSIWSWDGEAVAMILNQTNVAVGANLTFTGTGLSLDSGDVLLVVWNDNGAYATNTISNLRSSVEIIPEPSAFGLLAGLGALALVGSRRRRKSGWRFQKKRSRELACGNVFLFFFVEEFLERLELVGVADE